MRRTAILVIASLVAFATTAASAFAATNGMLAAVADGKIVTLNTDGSGLRTLWTPPAAGELSGLAWSPDGNKLAYSYAGKILIYDLPNASVSQLPNSGSRDVDPAWSPSGRQLTYRRISLDQETATFDFDGRPMKTTLLNPATLEFAWAPNSTPEVLNIAWKVGTLLFVTGMELGLRDGVFGAPAWSPDSKRVAYVAQDNGIDGAGLFSDSIGSGNDRVLHAPLPVTAPRWSPDGAHLVYIANGAARTVTATRNGTSLSVPGIANVTSVDWQPCTPGVSFAECVSYSPPVCSATALTVTTQSEQTVNLPVPDCTNPGSRSPSYVIVKAPANGSLAGLSYTPAPGFIGQDEVSYRVSNGFGESEPVTVRIFVVRRAPSPPPPNTGVSPAVKGPPYLTARATPRLDRKRTTLVKLVCDQNCSFEVRLTGTLKKSKKTVRGTILKRTLAAGRVLSLRLRLPTKPKGTLKSVYVTGTVRNAAGEKRAVKLPVRLPR